MTTPQKQELAQYGDRITRLALLRDPNKAVHPYLLKNRKLTLDELRIVAGHRNVNPDVLVKIAEHRDWTRDSRIVLALVQNPKTPPQAARRVLDKLAPGELRRVARDANIPRAVAIAAREKLGRSSS